MAYENLISAYSLSPPNYPLLFVSLITFAFGYIEYIYSFALVVREGKSPFPVWMHTFYLAHDSTYCIRLFIAASTHDWNWFLTGMSAALLVWIFFELLNLYMAVTVEREEIWGAGARKDKRNDKMGMKSRNGIGRPLLDVVVQITGFFCVVNLFISFVGADCLFEWCLFTFVVMAWGPGILWCTREDRRGCSVGLAWVIVGGTINTFAPWSMWVMAMPETFGGAWFYASGIVFTAIALMNVGVVSQSRGNMTKDAKQNVPIGPVAMVGE
ncbi:uncharacterized protein LY89DRAFT_728197 [Mollisia scopiformis]|uniref:Uncharacterized protein n=1 Tax=Mollisia scopiformis TaxID=149040 RepID=A0A194XUR9_MOLSC|nr:uncharacterized protein LY89DRAFT_728197 [Mollisia scopiformis]KUJ23452.1 hypothetical protein LY89DRAFT_728197 [Mollisia scopiformis]